MIKIKSIEAKKILDSRKKPTIEVLAEADGFSVKAGVPSGASKGKMEAKVINVKKAIQNINEIIAPKLIGKDPTNQKGIDDFLIGLDGTKNKSKLGANAIVGVSMAICRAGAAANNLPLYKYIAKFAAAEAKLTEVRPRQSLPVACFNIINGGAHSQNDLDIQEFMIVPQQKNFSNNFEAAKKIYKKLGQIIKKRFGKIEIGDEGGFSPPISQTREALELIKEVSNGFKDIKLMLDCAASQFQEGEKYRLEGKELTKEQLINFYKGLISQYPIIGLEDPFGQDDWQLWHNGYSEFSILNSKFLIIGDDLLVTNPDRIREAAKKTACNGAIIKINQIGTVSEAIEAVKLAKSYNWRTMVSHRSGETLDDFIADFSVGVGADFIKTGAPARPERLAKYHRLLEIEKELRK